MAVKSASVQPGSAAQKAGLTAGTGFYLISLFLCAFMAILLVILQKFPVDAGKCFDDAVKRNVAYVPGSVFYADGKGQNTLRLNYSNADEEKIRRGVKALGEMFKQKISEVK